jgi:hypothetical protein
MENRKEKFNVHGLYNGYDKKHKERDALDYYATPTEEVVNILKELNINFENSLILEPCVGGGHMLDGILQYLKDNKMTAGIAATDIQDRGYQNTQINSLRYGLDFLDDSYLDHMVEDIDYIIMNPPYSTIEPFTMKALSIANKGVLLLGRLQFLEGQGRYDNILKDYPPTDVYVYVDRIKCYKNGDFSQTESSAQAYAWFYWDFEETVIHSPRLHWIRRVDKKGE